jgi:chromosome partitioning protein
VFVINRRVSNTAIGRDVIDALRGYPLTIARAVINQRIAFAESAARGLSVLETAPTGLAGREISVLARELLAL